MKQKQGVNPTKQHATKCPKLSGKNCTCDGYHTFDELYDHRIALFIALSRHVIWTPPYLPWKSKLHSDGSRFRGWFVMGVGKEKGKQITYHLPISKWKETKFAKILKKAPEWDGHTPDEVIERLYKL